MAIERKREEVPRGVIALAGSMEEFVIEHGLLHCKARTAGGQWFVTVEEPGLWAGVTDDDDPNQLKITYEEFDL